MIPIKQAIRTFINHNFYVTAGFEANDRASLRELGIVDSTGVLEVILFLEDAFKITVEDAEILPENLDSIEAIAHFVERKRASAAT
jgi:acyl carrier protein